MEVLKSLIELKKLKFLFSFLTVFALLFFVGCKDSVMETEDTDPTTDKEAMEKIADEDSSIQSFDESFNEDELMDFGLGKIQTQIYPFRVWHRVHLVNRNLTVDIQGDTAYATLTKNFEGTLFIKASYDSSATEPDTIIQKVFNATITRNLIFVKVANTGRPLLNWRLAAVSLPEGGVLSENIDIKKLTIFLPNGESIVIESPNDFYLARHHGWLGWLRYIPILPRLDSVLVRVEIFSAYEDEDFVTLTFGRNRFGGEKHKRIFELISSTPVSGGFEKVYEQNFRTHA
ncbi:MAG TPA: hypothetical protein VLN45_03225, partial [Ignavibacteriaceae bacterium]|nr:hypothetical protein [Ignavibacteriaceae bacterium]